jgi:GxxExxY protein
MSTDLLLKEEVYAIVGAAMEVHKELGQGFLEAVYQEAMEIECRRRDIPYNVQKQLNIFYKGQKMQKEYFPDLICYGQVIVELKAITRLTNIEEAQLDNYLKATGLQVGVLLNFGAASLDWRRRVRSK